MTNRKPLRSDDGKLLARFGSTKGPLVDGFSKAGAEFADVVRFYLPKTILGSPLEATRARVTLKKAADKATLDLKRTASRYLASGSLREAVIGGQKSAAASVGLKFGGVNEALVQRLTYQAAMDLGKAASSPNAYLATTLRKATAIATQADDHEDRAVNVDRVSTRSMLDSAKAAEAQPVTAKRLLSDLDLDKGDYVLFLSGRSMEASAYSKLLTRTRGMEALNLGKAGELTDNGYLYVETSEHDGVDERDICFFLQGKVWALAANPLGIPLLPSEYGLPPWHPNCAHTFGAWQAQFEGRGAVDKVIDSHVDDAESLAPWLEGGKTRAYQLVGAK